MVASKSHASARTQGQKGRGAQPRPAPHPSPRSGAIYRALADDTRRAILTMLANGPASAGQVAAAFPAISRPGVTKHLGVLRDAGLVTCQAKGRARIYALDTSPLAEVVAYVAQIDRMWSQALVNLGDHLDAI